MSALDIILLIAIGCAVVAALRFTHKKKKSGGGCAGCSGCSGCSGSCGSCQYKSQTKLRAL